MSEFKTNTIDLEKIKIPERVSVQIQESGAKPEELTAFIGTYQFNAFQVGIEHINLEQKYISFVKKQDVYLYVGRTYVALRVEIRSKKDVWCFYPNPIRVIDAPIINCESKVESWNDQENTVGFENGMFWMAIDYESDEKDTVPYRYQTPEYTISDISMIIRAVKYASHCHRFQMRKGGGVGKKIPYINHPIEVMEFLVSNGVTNVDTLVAAVCHDVVEDCVNEKEEPISEAELAEVIGDKAASIVLECTDDKSLSKAERKKEQLERISKASQEAKLVKLGDKLSNLSDAHTESTPFKNPDEKIGYLWWTLAIARVCGPISPLYKKILELLKIHHGIYYTTQEDLQSHLDTYYEVIKDSR